MDLQAVCTDVERVIATEEKLASRIAGMVAFVGEHYGGTDLLLVGVLKGEAMSIADLTRVTQLNIELDWMAVTLFG